MASCNALLDDILRATPRRYRAPTLPEASDRMQQPGAATGLSVAAEQARQALQDGRMPDEETRLHFIESLVRLIHEAMRPEQGDPVFQAMVLRHRVPLVREHASLAAHAGKNRRAVHAAVNAIAHPHKQQRMPPGPLREALAQLHAAAASASWSAVLDIARRLHAMPGIADDSPVKRGLAPLLGGSDLANLQRLDALASDRQVQQYQSLWDRHGPRPGSATATAQGAASRQRGAAVEALTTQAFEALARRLTAQTGDTYRVASSLRVPATIPGNAERAKTEWDAVLLRQAPLADGTEAWDICLLAEAKASVDAASNDLPRLLRGLRLLAHADKDAAYSFACQQGTVRLNGASLCALGTDEASLSRTVLYCCDAPADAAPRLLAAASRMQLLSAQASLDFAARLADGQPADARMLEPVWHQLLQGRAWSAVLNQYPMLRRVRELMVHPDDLCAAITGQAQPPRPQADPNPGSDVRCALE